MLTLYILDTILWLPVWPKYESHAQVIPQVSVLIFHYSWNILSKKSWKIASSDHRYITELFIMIQFSLQIQFHKSIVLNQTDPLIFVASQGM